MSYDDVVQRAWCNNTLLSVLFELTYSCNLNCSFCYNDRSHRGRPLSLDQYRQLIDALAEMAVLHLTLSGGEPLVHQDFWAIGSRARDRGFVIRIKSNGHAIEPWLARRLKQEVDPFLIEVSLHGACAATHDQQTRVEGSFIQLMRNIRAMLQMGTRVQLNIPLTRWNEAEVGEMCALADRLGLPLQIDPDITPRDDGQKWPFCIAATEAGIRRLNEINQARLADVPSIGTQATHTAGSANPGVQKEGHREHTGKHCGAGSSGLAIDPYGIVYPCVQWRIPLGSLHSESVKDIWQNSEELKRVRALSVKLGEMRKSGKAEEGLAFCPGVAQVVTGSPFKPYTAFRLRRAAAYGCQEAI
jgi:MoaA/NifB/PqqE/SkfB family radical SAM enzyme